jgi:hypothetical protein
MPDKSEFESLADFIGELLRLDGVDEIVSLVDKVQTGEMPVPTKSDIIKAGELLDLNR